MFSLFENHPILTLFGVFTGIFRFVLELINPEYASLFGAAVGIPVTSILVRDHFLLKQQLREARLIR